MWPCSTLVSFITVCLMASLLTECYPRSYLVSSVRGGSLAGQQLLNSPFQAAAAQSLPKTTPVPKTLSVYCHEDALEVAVNSALLAPGFPVSPAELWLGPVSPLNATFTPSCGAVQTGLSVLTIYAYFKDCGTQLSATGDSVTYSNVLVYSPRQSSDGVLHTDGSVVTVQCQYQRLYSVDSAAVAPTWIPFASTASVTDHLDFRFQLMTDDWQYERGSNMYFLGDAIHLQASVTLAKHAPLLVFVDWCVATPTINMITSDLKYNFVDNGCFTDSRNTNSGSKFLQRSQGNMLNLLLDAFRFYELTSNLVYIHCYLKAIPAAYSASAQNRACSYIGGSWQSVDGSDAVCGSCEQSNQIAANPLSFQPSQMMLAPAVKLPNFGPIFPGQALKPSNSLLQTRKNSYSGLSKRGTDMHKDWNKLATLGPLLLIPKKENTTQSSGSKQFGSAEVFSESVIKKQERLFNSIPSNDMVDVPKLKAIPKTGRFGLLEEDDLLLKAFDLDPIEGSGLA